MRLPAAVLVAPVVLALAGCGSTEDHTGGGGNGAVDPPPGFTLLDASTATDDLADAMRRAQTAQFTLAMSVSTAEGGAWATERSGTVRWHDTGADVDLTWSLRTDNGLIPESQAGVIIVDGAAYLGGDWVNDLRVDGDPPASRVRITEEDVDVLPDLRGVVDETTRWATPAVHLAVMATTVDLHPAEVVDLGPGEQGLWYEGEAATAGAATEDGELNVVWQRLADEGVETVPSRLLVDRDNLPRELTAEASEAGIDVTISVSYADWGQVGPVRAPDDFVTWAEIASASEG